MNFPNPALPCLRSGCRLGWASEKSMCHTGVGKTWRPSPTVACVGCQVSPVTRVSVPTLKNHRCRGLGPTLAPPQPVASSVKKPLVRYTTTWGLLVWVEDSLFCFSSCVGNPSQISRPSCGKPCSQHTNCANCTSHAMECMWCSSTQRCVDSNAYVISFPYGQCLEWLTGDCFGKSFYC